MNNTNFAEILDGLEKDVFDLVSNLERQISGRMASYGSGSRIPAKNEPVRPFQPKWRGLRGALRWLWKGHSRDNPDYAHLYDKEVKSESKNGRPTLAEYLVDVRLIDGFAEEICSEVLGDFLNESSIDISDLLRQFKLDFRNIILKYKNLIKGSTSPEVASAGWALRASGGDARNKSATAPAQASKSVEPKAPETQNSEPASSQKDSEEGSSDGDKEEAPAQKDASSEEKENVPPAAQDEEEKSVSAGSESDKTGSQRKSKSHSANIGRWFKEAMEAKKKGGDELKPSSEWLNPKGIIKPEKLPWVIAWMGTKSHKDLHKDEDVRSELQSAIGSSFKDFVPRIARKKSDSLVGYLRKNMPMTSDEEFKSLVSKLYGSEYEGSWVAVQKAKKKKDDSSKSDTTNDDEEVSNKPDIQEIKIKKLSSLYEGMENKETILQSVEDKLIDPAFEIIEDTESAESLGNWWISFSKERMLDDQETAESMVVRINSGALFDDIVYNSNKKIRYEDLWNLLKT